MSFLLLGGKKRWRESGKKFGKMENVETFGGLKVSIKDFKSRIYKRSEKSLSAYVRLPGFRFEKLKERKNGKKGWGKKRKEENAFVSPTEFRQNSVPREVNPFVSMTIDPGISQR